MALTAILIASLTTAVVSVFPTSNLQSDSVTTNTKAQGSFPVTVTFGQAFRCQPSFAVLLSGLDIYYSPSYTGYAITYGASTTAGSSFTITTVGQQLWGVTLRWLATIGEVVQIFPIEFTLDTTGPKIYDVPFDYPTLVQWTAATTDVVITSVLSSFRLNSDSQEYWVDVTIAKWNGAKYDYSGNSMFVLPKENLFGANAPFTTVAGTNVVKILGAGFSGTRITSTLLFVQAPSANPTPPYAVPSVVRDTSVYQITGAYSASLLNQYNTNGISPTATRVFGMEAFYYFAPMNNWENKMTISTTDGISSANYKSTDPNPGYSYAMEFYLSFAPTPPSSMCLPGCICDASLKCISCKLRGYWKASVSVDASGNNYCECLPGFYLTHADTCSQCPMSANCATCSMDQCGAITCNTCNCAQHRTLTAGACPCSPSYKENSPANAYCVRNI